MPVGKAHQVWSEQCEAAQTIKARFGVNFAEAAANHGDFARELPRFVSEVRHLFTADEIARQLSGAGLLPCRASIGRDTSCRCCP
jgi:hypothetical protein